MPLHRLAAQANILAVPRFPSLANESWKPEIKFLEVCSVTCIELLCLFIYLSFLQLGTFIYVNH